jgi:hypothetical protein
MNSNFLTVLQASETDRHNLFLETATRLGTPLRNIEKDFWVCFTLDLLFNGKPRVNHAFYLRVAPLYQKPTI